VVATGVRPRAVALPGAELPHVCSYAALLLDDQREAADSGDAVAIIGAGGIGVDVAHLLSTERGEFFRPGRKNSPRTAFYERYGLRVGAADMPAAPTRLQRSVTLMRRGGRIGEGIGPSTRWVALQDLEHAGVQMLTGVRYERIEADAVAITTADGESQRIPAATVVIAAGQEPETGLLRALADTGIPLVAVGGAAGSEGLDAGRAFREGFEAPTAVANALASKR